jgi:hypothetical protein
VFSVFIEDCRPIICGMALILDETVNNFISLFTLLKENTGKFPQSIITDQQITVILALTELRENADFPHFCHLLDQFHILKSVSKQLTQKLYQLDVPGLLKTMMYSRSLREYKEAALKMMEIDDDKFQNYMNRTMNMYRDKFC